MNNVALSVGAAFNLGAMSELCSGGLSQTQGFMHFQGVSEIVFFEKPRKWTSELRIG